MHLLVWFCELFLHLPNCSMLFYSFSPSELRIRTFRSYEFGPWELRIRTFGVTNSDLGSYEFGPSVLQIRALSCVEEHLTRKKKRQQIWNLWKWEEKERIAWKMKEQLTEPHEKMHVPEDLSARSGKKCWQWKFLSLEVECYVGFRRFSTRSKLSECPNSEQVHIAPPY